MMPGQGENPIFFNKKRTGRPEHLLAPHPLRPITSHFCLRTAEYFFLSLYLHKAANIAETLLYAQDFFGISLDFTNFQHS